MVGRKSYKSMHKKKPKYGPTAARAPSGADRDAVREEQDALNETMSHLFGADTNPTQLNPDGVAGPATNAVRSVIDEFLKRLPNLDDSKYPTRTAKLKALNEYLKTDAGKEFLKPKAAPDKEGGSPDISRFVGGMRDAVDGIPRTRNGFKEGSGVRNGPAAPDAAQPDPANKDGAPVEPPKPPRVRTDSLLDQPIGVPLAENEESGSLLGRPIDVAREPSPVVPSQGDPMADPDVVISRGRQQPGPKTVP